MKCELCEREVKTLNTCQECSTKYCNECGDPARGLCQDCIDFKENEGIDNENAAFKL